MPLALGHPARQTGGMRGHRAEQAPGPAASSRRMGWIVAATVLAMAGLRVATGLYPLWYDEYASLIFADQPLSRLWSRWMVAETNPPLFYTMAKGWQAMGLRSVAGLRLLPELGGLAELVLLAAAARIGWGWRAALAAVLLAGFSPHHVYAGQLLRGYIFAADGVLLAFIGLLLALREPGRARGCWIYAAGSALALQFHTTMLLWPPIAMAALALSNRPALSAARFLLLRRLAMANLAVLASGAWWLWITLLQLNGGSQNVDWIAPLTLAGYADLLARSLLLVNEAYVIERGLSLLVGAALAIAVVQTFVNPAARLAACVLAIGAALFWGLSLVHPIATPMTLFWLSGFVVLIIAGWAGNLVPPLRACLLTAVLAGLLGFNLMAHGSRLTVQDFGAAVRAAAATPGSALLVEHASFGLVMAKACERELGARPCPIPILTLGAPGGSFADALPHGPTLRPRDVPAALACCRQVFDVRTWEYDPLLHFGLARAADRRDWNDPFLEGPIPASRFDPARYSHPRR